MAREGPRYDANDDVSRATVCRAPHPSRLRPPTPRGADVADANCTSTRPPGARVTTSTSAAVARSASRRGRRASRHSRSPCTSSSGGTLSTRCTEPSRASRTTGAAQTRVSARTNSTRPSPPAPRPPSASNAPSTGPDHMRGSRPSPASAASAANGSNESLRSPINDRRDNTDRSRLASKLLAEKNSAWSCSPRPPPGDHRGVDISFRVRPQEQAMGSCATCGGQSYYTTNGSQPGTTSSFTFRKHDASERAAPWACCNGGYDAGVCAGYWRVRCARRGGSAARSVGCVCVRGRSGGRAERGGAGVA